MKHSILIVEDDMALSRGIILALQNNEDTFSAAYTINEAKNIIKLNAFDLIILDINLPDGDGLELLADIRKTSNIPVILLTANDMEVDIVAGLEMGADDYITKPFSLMVLRARVNTQFRKTMPKPTMVQIDDFTFDFDAMVFKKASRVIELSKTEHKLLHLLIENRGNTLTRDTLVDKIWTDGAEYVDENSLSVTVKRLRDKLEDLPSKPQYIKTMYGIGYSWVVRG